MELMLLSLFFSNNYCTEGDKIEVVKESLRWVIVAFCVAPPSCVIEHYSVLSNIPVTSYTMLYATMYM